MERHWTTLQAHTQRLEATHQQTGAENAQRSSHMPVWIKKIQLRVRKRTVQAVRVQNIACKESPREIFILTGRAHPNLHQQRKPDIDHLSRPSPSPSSSPSPPRCLHPPPTAHRRHGARQAWERRWRQTRNVARDAEMEPLSLLAEPTVWLTSGIPCRTRSSCSQERHHGWMEKIFRVSKQPSGISHSCKIFKIAHVSIRP